MTAVCDPSCTRQERKSLIRCALTVMAGPLRAPDAQPALSLESAVRIRVALVICALLCAAAAEAATLKVCASGCTYATLQPALDAAAPGDTILLRAGETFVGPFVLRAKPAS